MVNVQAAIILVVAWCALLKPSSGTVASCFEAQVARVVGAASAGPERLRRLPAARRSVQRTLDAVWPGSKVVLFGSLSTGLGSPTSDADLAVTLPRGVRPSPRAVRRAWAACRAQPDLYTHVHMRSRLPALTLLYAPYNVTCDVHFRVQPFETAESSLLHYLLHADERALHLAILVKHWAKLHKLIYRKYLTSYGMMMLVIFFLQQRSILPSVDSLQNNVPGNVLDEYRFNVAFARQRIVSNNSESLYQILGGFFEYYEVFDFDAFVVSPFIGYPVYKTYFENFNNLPNEFSLYKYNVANNLTKPFNVTAMCVQSLLMLNDNCAWRIDKTKTFKAKFLSAAKSFRNNKRCSFLEAIGLIASEKPNRYENVTY